MRSLIIIEVEHGENTDLLTEFAEKAHDLSTNYFDYSDYTMRVDLPERFVLE